MQTKDIVEKFGGVRGLARAIGVGTGTISYWVSSGTIPTRSQSIVLEAALRLGISLADGSVGTAPTLVVEKLEPPQEPSPQGKPPTEVFVEEKKKKPKGKVERPLIFMGNPSWCWILAGGICPPEMAGYLESIR